MPAQDSIVKTANEILEPKGLTVKSSTILQKLWAGYGYICQIQAVTLHEKNAPSKPDKQSFILKLVAPPSSQRGKRHHQDEGHLRKLISYQVEQQFYTDFASRLPHELADVAECIGSINEKTGDGEHTIAMVLTDLRLDFPVAGEKRGELDETQTYAALRWLASFHGFWWKEVDSLERHQMRLPPLEEAEVAENDETSRGLWLNGGYTYLATRLTEYRSLRSDTKSEWSRALCTPMPECPTKQTIAEVVAQVLAPSPKRSASDLTYDYETLIHGDVKSENLFTSAAGTEVAFFDFQYVGMGLGVCDLAKLFTCSVPVSLLAASSRIPRKLEMQAGERKLLESYHHALEVTSGKQYPWEVFTMHWRTALIDWIRFQASWSGGFWGNTTWLEARARHILEDREWRTWIVEAAGKKARKNK